MVSLNCKSCEWWMKYPLKPDKAWGICTVDSGGVVLSSSPATRNIYRCSKWMETTEENGVGRAYEILRNLAGAGCAECPRSMGVGRNDICVISDIVQRGKYHKCTDMTPDLCRYAKRIDALKQIGRNVGK